MQVGRWGGGRTYEQIGISPPGSHRRNRRTRMSLSHRPSSLLFELQYRVSPVQLARTLANFVAFE